MGIIGKLRSDIAGDTAGDTAGGLAGVTLSVRANPATAVLRAWDDLVDRSPGTDVTQLSTWADLRARVGFTALYLLAYRHAQLVAGAQILCRRVPVLGTVGYLPYGPLAPTGPQRAEILGVLTDTLRELGRRRLRMLFVQPPEGADDVSRSLLRRGFRPSAAGIAPAGSIRIDLSADLGEIRGRFGKRLKSWTNRWASRGVTVRPGDRRDIPLLVRFMDISSYHQNYQPLPSDYVTALYEELSATGHAALFVGEVDGVPVAVDLVTLCGDMIRGRLSGFDRRDEFVRLSVPAAIRWEIVRWGKANGYRWLDFGGLRPETLDALLNSDRRSEDTWPTVDQPKVTFGGTAYRYPAAVELIRPAPLRYAYDLVWRSATGQRALSAVKSTLRGSRRKS